MAGDGERSEFREHQGSDYPHMLERLVFFSDAVFAIAITLLVIEIAVPHIGHFRQHGSTHDYLQALANLLPSFFGYFLSFFVIGAYWAGHHRAFGLAASYDSKLVWPNMAMLCMIAFMPFATAFLSDNLGALVPAVFYNSVLLILSLLNLRLIRIVTSPPAVAIDAPPLAIAQVRARSLGVLSGAALAFVLTPVLPPYIAQLPIMTIGLWQRLFFARARKRLAAASAE
ncbi:MAG: DUF1211 domain-containing protein [Sphingobium sp.]|nr:DUF1211 domain-containing protein [Sphingobium sp.]